jgi:hypothetical protein
MPRAPRDYFRRPEHPAGLSVGLGEAIDRKRAMTDPDWTITYSPIPWHEPADAWQDVVTQSETDLACCDTYWRAVAGKVGEIASAAKIRSPCIAKGALSSTATGPGQRCAWPSARAANGISLPRRATPRSGLPDSGLPD